MEHLSVRVLGGFKSQARGTVQLTDDDSLSAVNHERALWRHQRQFTHEHLFLFSPFFFLQQEGDIQGRAISQAFAEAFQPVELGLADFIGVEIENTLAVIAFDGEHLGKDGLESQIFPPGGRLVRLQKFSVRIGLQFDQIWRDDDFFDSTEVNSFSGA